MNNAQKYPSRNPDAAWRVIDKEAVVVTPAEGLVRVFNETGARIWELAEGNRSIGEIGSEISSECDVSEPEAVSDVVAFVRDCEQKGLMVVRDEPSA